MKSHRPGLGIALILLMSVCFSMLDSTVKYLGGFLPVLLMLFSRYSFQALAMLFWQSRPNSSGFRVAHPKFQLIRGALLLMSSAMSFLGVQYLPLAEYTAIGMLTPVMVTVMAAWFLDEPVSRLRWALVCGGLTGAVLVIRPGSGLFGWPVLFPLAGVLSYASFQVLTRKLASLENPYTTHFYTGLIGMLILLPLVLWKLADIVAAGQAIQPLHVGLLLWVGFLGTIGHLFLMLALGLAPTAILMPFVYSQIGFAAVIGWIVFRNVPDGWAWIGMGVIALCGAASAWLNVRQGTPERPDSVLAADVVGD